MAVIQSGADTTLLTVDPTSAAARMTLYSASGAVLASVAGTTATSAIAVQGVTGGVPIPVSGSFALGAGSQVQLVAGTAAVGSVTLGAPLPAGTNAIGSVTLGAGAAAIGSVSLAAGSTVTLAAGAASIGSVTLGAALPAGGNTIGTVSLSAGTSVTLAAGAAAIGTVSLTGSLPAGANALGSVTLGAALPAGANTIGNVNVTGSLPAGTNMIGVVQEVDATVPGQKAKVNVGGDRPVSITNPNSVLGGIYATLSATGNLNVAIDPTVLFADEFESISLDTTGRWVSSGTVAAAVGAGVATLNPGTTANATAVINSQPAFPSFSSNTFGAVIAIEAAVTLGNHRFWGLGAPLVAPGTTAAPLYDAVGFELDTAGALRASVYNSGVRVYTQILTRPVDGANHRYSVVVRGDVAFWYLDTFDLPTASTLIGSGVQVLPIRLASLNSGSVTVGTPTMAVNGVALFDQGRNATQMSDGTYPHRKAKVGAGGDLVASISSPLASQAGIYASLNPYGSIRVTNEPSPMFFDPFDGVIDANKWITAGTTPTVIGGTLAANAGTISGATSRLTSVPTFASPGLGFEVLGCIVQVEAAPVTNVYRFWGWASEPGVPAYQAPAATVSLAVTDAIGFELDGAGNLYGVIYGNGTLVYRTTAISGTLWKDGNVHRYAIMKRSDVVFWFVEGQEVPVASRSYAAPAIQTLPVKFASYNNATAPAAYTFNTQAVAVHDSTSQTTTIGDGSYPWRKANLVPKAIQGTYALATQDMKDSGRIAVVLSATAIVSATVEAMFTLNIWRAGTVTSNTSYTVTAGKTFRMQAIQFGVRFGTPSTTVTFANARFNLRSGNATGSPLIFGDTKLASANNATPNSDMDIEDGLEFPAGTVLGVSHVDSATTLLLDVVIVGYEY